MDEIIWCDDSGPGITRKQVRGKWAYFAPDGARITDRDAIDRLNKIGLPPAYRDAWFNPDPNGHIQAVGWDDKGRKQYRYHLGFREAQESAKYELCSAFGRKLPRLRERAAEDLKRDNVGKDTTVAAIVRLLDLGHLRVGNEEYALKNKSFGATTLQKRHADLTGRTLKLSYRAKHGKQRTLTITDNTLVRFVKKMQDLRGQHLFHWLDKDGGTHAVTSTDVNDYIHAAMGDRFSAKNFRTWGASVVAFETLGSASEYVSLKAMLEPVTEELGNTPAIARKSYVHPRLIELAKDKDAQATFRETLRLPRATQWLNRWERGLIEFLEAEVQEAVAA